MPLIRLFGENCVAKGADQKLMFAERMGPRTGYCKGKGGSMPIADIRLGANGIAGEPKTIVFNLSGHGHLDMTAYQPYLAGILKDIEHAIQGL